MAKLSAASKAAVVSNNVYEEPGSEAAKPMGPADWVKQIKHTNPIVKPNEDNFVKETATVSGMTGSPNLYYFRQNCILVTVNRKFFYILKMTTSLSF